MGLKDRLTQFIEYKKIPRSAFEKRCGLSNGYTRNIKENIGSSKLENILSTFPELNRVWLLTGAGEMLKKINNAKSIGGVYTVMDRDEDVVMVDYVPISAHATFIDNLDFSSDGDKIPYTPHSTDERANINQYKIFEVDGDSMFPTIKDGALILAKEIPERSWHYAEGVVVAIYAEYVVVKRILRNELLTNNRLILGSDNEKYGQMAVQFSDIRALFKAKRIISSEIV